MANKLKLPPGATLESGGGMALPPGATLESAQAASTSQPATKEQAEQRGAKAETALSKMPDSYQGGVVDSGKRFLSSLFGSIPGMVTGPFHAATDPQTLDERMEHGISDPRAVLGQRLVTDPLKHAAQWYNDAFHGRVPDATGQALSVAPEALGSATGPVVAAEMVPKVASAAKWTKDTVFPAPKVLPPETHLAAVHPQNAPAAYEAAPALRNSAAHLQVDPETAFPMGGGPTGKQGLDTYSQVLDHAMSTNNEDVENAIKPVENEIVTLPQGSQIAQETGTSTPTVRQLRNTQIDLNKEITLGNKTGKYFARDPVTRNAVDAGDVASLQREAHVNAASDQAKDALYDHVKNRTGVDIRPIQRQTSNLIKLNKEFWEPKNGIYSKTLAGDAQFQTKQPPSLIAKGAKLAAEPYKTGISSLDSKLNPAQSPLDTFNARMRGVFADNGPFMPREGPNVPPNPTIQGALPPGQYDTGASSVPPNGPRTLGPQTGPDLGPVSRVTPEYLPPDSPVPPAIRGALKSAPISSGPSPLDPIFQAKPGELNWGPRTTGSRSLTSPSSSLNPRVYTHPTTGQPLVWNGTKWIDVGSGSELP